MGKLITVQEAADMLRVSRSTVWRWCRNGTIKSAIKIGRGWRIRLQEVEDLVSTTNFPEKDLDQWSGEREKIVNEKLPGDLSIKELAQRCRQESDIYRAGQPTNEVYCLELFRRALQEKDQAAWKAIYAQYQALVADWIRNHPRYGLANESISFLVNRTFERFWWGLAGVEQVRQFKRLAQLLLYLKSCAHCAVIDACRRKQRHSPDSVAWETVSNGEVVDEDVIFETAAQENVREIFEGLIFDRLQGRIEQEIATLSWVYGLKPREILAHRPHLFADVQQVYQIKRNIMERLLRDPEIQKLRRQMR